MFNTAQELQSKPIDTTVIREGNAPIEDIHCADTVIHWESTVGLEALYLGKPVIHCDLGGSLSLALSALSFEPLSRYEDFHWTTKTSSELRRVIEKAQEIPEDKLPGTCPGIAELTTLKTFILCYSMSYKSEFSKN